jgi:hypothetical protein
MVVTITVVTLSQVHFVPRDRTSSWRLFCKIKDKHGPPKLMWPLPPPPWLSQNCCHAVVFLYPLKHNRHDTFLACRNCRWDKTRAYLNDTVVTIVNCCQRVATKLFFMFPFVASTTLTTLTTRSRQLRPYGNHASELQRMVMSTSMDHLHYRLNFDLNKSRQKFHHSLKEHHKISNIPKFRCEML